MTGQFHVTSRLPGQYVTFSRKPIGFLLALAMSVFLVGAGLLMIVLANVRD